MYGILGILSTRWVSRPWVWSFYILWVLSGCGHHKIAGSTYTEYNVWASTMNMEVAHILSTWWVCVPRLWRFYINEYNVRAGTIIMEVVRTLSTWCVCVARLWRAYILWVLGQYELYTGKYTYSEYHLTQCNTKNKLYMERFCILWVRSECACTKRKKLLDTLSTRWISAVLYTMSTRWY